MNKLCLRNEVKEMIKTAVICIPLLYGEEYPQIKNMGTVDNLNKLLDQGYRIKIMHDILYHDVVFSHYVLEKEV